MGYFYGEAIRLSQWSSLFAAPQTPTRSDASQRHMIHFIAQDGHQKCLVVADSAGKEVEACQSSQRSIGSNGFWWGCFWQRQR